MYFMLCHAVQQLVIEGYKLGFRHGMELELIYVVVGHRSFHDWFLYEDLQVIECHDI